jgi:hypothetical protein
MDIDGPPQGSTAALSDWMIGELAGFLSRGGGRRPRGISVDLTDDTPTPSVEPLLLLKTDDSAITAPPQPPPGPPRRVMGWGSMDCFKGSAACSCTGNPSIGNSTDIMR